MSRWLRVALGPVPATVLLLPVLFAGGMGKASSCRRSPAPAAGSTAEAATSFYTRILKSLEVDTVTAEPDR